MEWETLGGVVLGGVLALLGGRLNRRHEMRRSTQAQMFELMKTVREQVGAASQDPLHSNLKDEIGQLFRLSVLADRGTHQRTKELIELEWRREAILREESRQTAYTNELSVLGMQEHADVLQQINQSVEMLDEHLGDRLRRVL